jgi:4a-hydroxytetrahydrobiopterin dehydratase
LEKLNSEQVKKHLEEVPEWTLKNNSIVRKFKTSGFPQTLGLVTAIGAVCQQHDHHPDYLTMKYAEVELSFSTHSAGGLTEKDFKIAGELDKLKF